MRVDIRTSNGRMRVDLDEFLPTTQARVRKLFGLMRFGTPREDKDEVRRYLVGRGQEAERNLRESQDRLSEERKRLEDLERRYEDLRQERIDARNRVTALREEVRAAERILEKAPTWPRMFDDICGR